MYLSPPAEEELSVCRRLRINTIEERLHVKAMGVTNGHRTVEVFARKQAKRRHRFRTPLPLLSPGAGVVGTHKHMYLLGIYDNIVVSSEAILSDVALSYSHFLRHRWRGRECWIGRSC